MGNVRRGTLALAVATIAALAPAAAHAAVSTTLTSVNGEGIFDSSLSCDVGDGPSWRYGFSGGSAPAGPLQGTWDGTFQVHDANQGQAFIPNAGGRVAIALNRGGTAYFDMGGGDCGNAPLTLTTPPGGDPVATGTVPVTATFGTGAARGLSGNGTANVSIDLGPGADNHATINLSGDFHVTAPQPVIKSASGRWQNLTTWLQNKLSVSILVVNDGPIPSIGNAYDVRLNSVTSTGGATASIPPQTGVTIASGQAGTFPFTLNGAKPNTTYTLNVTIQGRDGLDALLPPVNGVVSVKAPLLP